MRAVYTEPLLPKVEVVLVVVVRGLVLVLVLVLVIVLVLVAAAAAAAAAATALDEVGERIASNTAHTCFPRVTWRLPCWGVHNSLSRLADTCRAAKHLESRA